MILSIILVITAVVHALLVTIESICFGSGVECIVSTLMLATVVVREYASSVANIVRSEWCKGRILGTSSFDLVSVSEDLLGILFVAKGLLVW